MATTIERIHTRLGRCTGIAQLDADRRGELVAAAADVGDGRAADELSAIATEWERLAGASGPSSPTAWFYREAAADLRLRAAALRGVAQVRTLVSTRRELGVSPGSVAAEKLVVDHDVTLRISQLGAAGVVRAARAWYELISDRRLHLVLDDAHPGGAVTISGMLFDCAITVAGPLDPADHPAVAGFLGVAHRQRGDQPQPAIAITVAELDALLTAITASGRTTT